MIKEGALWRPCGSSSGKCWRVAPLCAYVCVTVILDRKRLRCGLGIRCVSVRTVIKKHNTQSTKSCETSRRPLKRRAKLQGWWHLRWPAAIGPSACNWSYWGPDYGSFGKDNPRSSEGASDEMGTNTIITFFFFLVVVVCLTAAAGHGENDPLCEPLRTISSNTLKQCSAGQSRLFGRIKGLRGAVK